MSGADLVSNTGLGAPALTPLGGSAAVLRRRGVVMSAYLIANVKITDAAQYEEYKRLSTIAMRAHGAEVCVRSGSIEVLEGDWQPERLIVLKFADVQHARRFY